MSEQTRIEYSGLFEIRLLHHYWLDDGATPFDNLGGPQKVQRLASYDVRSFLSIAPTMSTAKELAGLGCVFRRTELGCVVGAHKGRTIPDASVFEFVATARDQAFANYTALTLLPRRTFEWYCQPDKKVYRYKENVPLLSNKTGTARVGSLFLSQEIPDSAYSVESLFRSGGALMQLTGDQPGGGTQQLDDDASTAPVYLHQGDSPKIAPPDGLVGAPDNGILLTDDIPDDAFLIIRLETLRASGGDFGLVDAQGYPKRVCPVFQVRFKNRSTFWRYLNRKTGAVSTEATPFPLTYFGNAAVSKPKPSQGLVKAERSGGKTTRLISEIYV